MTFKILHIPTAKYVHYGDSIGYYDMWFDSYEEADEFLYDPQVKMLMEPSRPVVLFLNSFTYAYCTKHEQDAISNYKEFMIVEVEDV